MIQEQTGIQIIGQVNQNLGLTFLYDKTLRCGTLFGVLVFTFLTCAGLDKDRITAQTGHSANGLQCQVKAFLGFFRVNRLGGAYSCTCRRSPYRSTATLKSGKSASYRRKQCTPSLTAHFFRACIFLVRRLANSIAPSIGSNCCGCQPSRNGRTTAAGLTVPKRI